ncbi:MAG: MurR/RpiR family transcriptional regulator [Oscillospiraceae bacterium]|nr:MurR/RpiR family transcriptional regulator [Oscillospiraceae bacterium]
MSDDIISSIRGNMDKFSKSQKRVASFIANNYDKVVYMTAGKIAYKVGVSESTVVRFAMEIGFDGYPDFQKNIKNETKNKLTVTQRISSAKEQYGEDDNILDKILNMDIEKIKTTLSLVSKEKFLECSDIIIKANKIYIIGTGSTFMLSNFLYFYFNLIFNNVQQVFCFNDSGMFNDIVKIKKEDVLVGFTFPRYSKQTVRAFLYARDNGAKTIAITDNQNSPLYSIADITLFAKSEMTSFVDSLVAPLSIINALIIHISIKKDKNLKENFDDLENVLNKYYFYKSFEDNFDE